MGPFQKFKKKIPRIGIIFWDTEIRIILGDTCIVTLKLAEFKASMGAYTGTGTPRHQYLTLLPWGRGVPGHSAKGTQRLRPKKTHFWAISCPQQDKDDPQGCLPAQTPQGTLKPPLKMIEFGLMPNVEPFLNFIGWCSSLESSSEKNNVTWKIYGLGPKLDPSATRVPSKQQVVPLPVA